MILLKIRCILIIFKDKIRNLLPNVLHVVIFPFSRMFMRLMPQVSSLYVMRMNRYTDHNLWDRIVKDNFDSILEVIPQLIPQKCSLHNTDEMSIRRTILLKNCNKKGGKVVEKGVLLLKFTSTFDFFYRKIDIANLLEDFFYYTRAELGRILRPKHIAMV